MTEKIGHYTEQESRELWEAWQNRLALDNPKLAEEIVKGIIESEGVGFAAKPTSMTDESKNSINEGMSETNGAE